MRAKDWPGPQAEKSQGWDRARENWLANEHAIRKVVARSIRQATITEASVHYGLTARQYLRSPLPPYTTSVS